MKKKTNQTVLEMLITTILAVLIGGVSVMCVVGGVCVVFTAVVGILACLIALLFNVLLPLFGITYCLTFWQCMAGGVVLIVVRLLLRQLLSGVTK